MAGLPSGTAQATLPWSWYSEPELLRREQERIFRLAWQYTGPPSTTDEEIEEPIAFDDQVGLEDRALVESVQAGVGSGLLQEGA